MKFNERKEFTYDQAVYKRSDTATALRMHDEYITKHSGKPYPVWHELSREPGDVDPLWNQPVGGRDKFLRQMSIPALITAEKKKWGQLKPAQVTTQTVRLWVSSLALQREDYFPLPGDSVQWSGYRYQIVAPEFEPNSYWQQTDVWLGIIFSAVIAPLGDHRPAIDPAAVAPAEKSAVSAIIGSATVEHNVPDPWR